MGFSRPGTKDGLGTFRTPFSAHRYKDIQMELSHVTLAQRAPSFVHNDPEPDTVTELPKELVVFPMVAEPLATFPPLVTRSELAEES